MMFWYGADGSGIENISGAICSTNGKQSWTTLYSSRLIRQFWLDILSYVIQLILKFCLYFYQSVCPCLPGSCQYSKYRPITVLRTTFLFQVPASSAPPKEAVYEEATKKLPVVQTELCLKKLSDYKTLSKVTLQVNLVQFILNIKHSVSAPGLDGRRTSDGKLCSTSPGIKWFFWTLLCDEALNWFVCSL